MSAYQKEIIVMLSRGKKFVSVSAMLLTLLAAALPPLPSAKAPLQKPASGVKSEVKSVGTITFSPETGTFFCGSKRVVFKPDGNFGIYAENRLLCNSILMLTTPYKKYQRSAPFRKDAGPYDGKGMQIRNIRTTADSIAYDGVAAWNSAGQPLIARSWKVDARIQDGKRIRVEVEYELPDQTAKPTDSFMFFVFYHAKECSEPKLGSWIPGEKKPVGSFKPASIRVKYADPGDTYTLCPQNWWRAWSLGGVHLRFDFNRAKMTFFIELADGKNGSAPAPAARMKVLDDLTIPPRGKNLLPNPYFADPLRFRTPTGFDAQDMKEYYSTDARFGRYSFLQQCGREYFTASVPLSPGPYVYSFYAKGAGPLTVYLRSAGQAFEKYLKVKVDSPDRWTRYELPFVVPVENAVGFTHYFTTAGMKIDGIQLERGTKATAFEAPAVEACQLGGFFFPGGTDVQLDFELSTLEKKVAGSGVISIRNFYNEPVWKQDFTYEAAAGKYPKLSFKPGKLPDGVYVIRLDYGKTAPPQYFRAAVMPFLKNRHPTARIFSLGYDGHLGVRKSVSESYLARLRAIGIGIVGHTRMFTPEVDAKYKQYGIIPFDAGFDFRAKSDVLQKRFPDLKNVPPHGTWFYIRDMDIHFWFPQKNLLADYRLLGGWNEAYRRKFIQVLQTEIRKYPKRVAYCFGSEAPHSLKDDPHYPELFAAFRKAVKGVYPDALVFEGGEPSMDVGSPGIGVDFTSTVLKRLTGKARSDFVNAHTYTKDVSKIYRNFRGLVKMMKTYPEYADAPICLTEGMHFYPYHIAAWNTEPVCWCGEGWLGFPPSYDMGWQERLSTAYFARAWLIFMTEYRRLWCACSSAENTRNFALDVNLSPRAFQKVPNTLGILLGNPRKYLGDFTFAPETRCLVWEDDEGRPLAAVWNEDRDVDSGCKDAPMAKLDYPAAEYIDLMGVRRQPARPGEFPVSPIPLFIRGRAGDSAAFTKALAAAVLNDPGKPPCRISFEIVSPDRLKLILMNQLGGGLEGTLTVFGKQHPFTLPPAGEQSVLVQLPKAIRAGRMETLRIPYACDIRGFRSANTLTLNCFAVPRFRGGWTRIPVIPLTNAVGKRPFSASDFSAGYQLAWDEKKLYLRVKVKDNVFAPGNVPGYRWNYDILQVYFDTRCSAMKTGKDFYDEDDYEYGLMPAMDGKRCEVWRAVSPDMQLTFGIAAPKNNTLAPEIPARFTRTPDGYVYEAEFPADYLLPMKLQKGYNFAFGLFAADRDSDAGADKGLVNTTRPGKGCWSRPDLWPLAVLTE